jgi:hypothetical protein
MDAQLAVCSGRSVHDHEPGVAVSLDLRPFVRLQGILDRQRMEAELFPDEREILRLRIDDVEPHEWLGAAQNVANFTEGREGPRTGGGRVVIN